MKRSFPLAQFWLRPVWSPRRPIFDSPSLGSVFSRQFSASGGGGLCESGTGLPSTFTRYSPPVTSHSARHADAFTLIELLVVVALIAVLAGITLAALGGINQRAARDRARGEVAAIVNAIQSYQLQNGNYPPVDSGGITYVGISGFLGSARVDTNDSGLISDPYGAAYVYRTNGTGMRNPASFDVYSQGADSGATNDDIGNW